MPSKGHLEEWERRLPPPPSPVGSYLPWVIIGNTLYTAGILPLSEGKLQYRGKVGRDLTVEVGYQAARLCALNAVAVLKAALGGLQKVRRIVQVLGFVASHEGFTDQPKVLNGATELLVEIFGDSGKPTRLAVGASELPLGAPVEISLVAEIEQ